jgi:glucose-6-phosphate-specific signal transduction histidine kinase
VCGDTDLAALFLPGPVRLALQVEVSARDVKCYCFALKPLNLLLFLHREITLSASCEPLRKVLIGALASLAMALSTAAFAQAQFGTAAEAKAMLEKAVAAVKADKAKALAMFNNVEGGFKDRDLQPFCFNVSDGKIVAATVPGLLGTDIRTLKDKTGRVFGEDAYKAAIEGKISEISYMFPRPGTDPRCLKR